jgi:hypothetical protein
MTALLENEVESATIEDMENLSIEDLENLSRKRILENFSQITELFFQIKQLGYDFFAMYNTKSNEETSVSDAVTRNLFSRMLTDFHAIPILAFRGYCLQSATLVATVFELSFAIACIHNDDKLANKWLLNPNGDKPFLPVYDTIRMTTKKMFSEPEKANHETKRCYAIYQELCRAKHAHKDTQSGFNVFYNEAIIAFHFGPDPTPRGISMSAFSLGHLFQLFLNTIIILYNFHINVKNDIFEKRLFQTKEKVHLLLDNIERYNTKSI